MKKEQKIKKKTNIVENAGKVLLNFGQVLFATLFLGGVIRGEIPPYLMMVIGGTSAILCVFLGLLLTSKEIKDKEE